MKDRLLKLSANVQTLMWSEEGQDLIEYALVVALIAFGSVATMQSLSKNLNNIFVAINGTLTNALT